MKNAGDALRLSKQTNNKKGEIEADRNLSGAFVMAGDYSRGLEYALDALKKSEALKKKNFVVGFFWVVGFFYGVKGNTLPYQEYLLKSEKIFEEMHSDRE